MADDWQDSDRIASTVIPQCGEVIENEFFFDLDADKDQKSIWSVNCLVGENKTLSVDIDALSGEFIKTRQAGIGW